MKVKMWKCESESVKVKIWKCENKSVKLKVWKWKCESESVKVWNWKSKVSWNQAASTVCFCLSLVWGPKNSSLVENESISLKGLGNSNPVVEGDEWKGTTLNLKNLCWLKKAQTAISSRDRRLMSGRKWKLEISSQGVKY